MGKKTREDNNRYEDGYIRYECQPCKRSFIVGDMLSRYMSLSCPYCRSEDLEYAAAAEADGDLDMGCLGLYYSLYDDGSLMLYTEEEFMEALSDAKIHGVPGETLLESLTRYCVNRDRYES